MFTFLFLVTRPGLYRQGGGWSVTGLAARRSAFALWLACGLLLCTPLPTLACLDAARAATLAETWLRAEPVRGLPAGLSLQDGGGRASGSSWSQP